MKSCKWFSIFIRTEQFIRYSIKFSLYHSRKKITSNFNIFPRIYHFPKERNFCVKIFVHRSGKKVQNEMSNLRILKILRKISFSNGNASFFAFTQISNVGCKKQIRFYYGGAHYFRFRCNLDRIQTTQTLAHIVMWVLFVRYYYFGKKLMWFVCKLYDRRCYIFHWWLLE